MVKDRMKNIDCLKGIAILLVVLGHSIQYLYGNEVAFHNRLFNYIYSFHMPLFMFISGFVSYKIYVSWDNIKKRAYQLLPPFFICPLIASLLFEGKFEINSFLRLLKNPDSGLWFLYVLFIISTYFTIVRLTTQRIGRGISENDITTQKWQTIILLVSGLFLFFACSIVSIKLSNNEDINFDCGTPLIALHSVFYMSGLITKIYYERFIDLLKKSWMFLMIIWFLLASFWEFGHKPTFIANPNLIVRVAYYYITAFAGIFMMIAASLKFVKQERDDWLLKSITSLGTMTLGIYALHLSFIIGVVRDWVVLFEWNHELSVLTVFVLTTLGSVLLIKIVELGNLAPQLILGKNQF